MTGEKRLPLQQNKNNNKAKLKRKAFKKKKNMWRLYNL